MTDKELYEHRERQKFSKWRDNVSKRLPEISARVFALRGKGYMGCGFHWGLEKSLGFVINKINNFDEPLGRDVMDRISMQVIVEGLFKDVAKIKKELQLKSNDK